jgi:hypothetical protein
LLSRDVEERLTAHEAVEEMGRFCRETKKRQI